MHTSITKNNNILTLLVLLVSVCIFALPHITHAGIQDGLVGHWTFDGKDMLSSTTVRDISSTRATGTLTNMDQKSSRVSGKFGQALKFDGVDDGISMTSNSIIGTSMPNGYAVSIWVKRSTPGTGGYVFERGYDEPSLTISSQYGWVYCGTKNSAATQFGLHTTQLSEGWHHVVCSVNPQTGLMYMYLDGSLSATSTITDGDTLRSSSSYSLGKRSQIDTGYTNGSVDDARIYNRALSAAEITQLYKKGATRLGVTPSRNITSASTTCTGISCGLVGHWTFDGKDTNWATRTTLNRGGNANNGTLVGLSATSSARRGKLGQGMFFPSTATSSVIVGTNPKPTGDFTISFWTYQNQNSSVFVSNYNGYGGKAITMNDNGFWLALGVDDNEYVQIPKLPTRKWYYISGVRDSVTGVLSLYVNGVLANASAPNTSLGPVAYGLNGTMAIGAFTGIVGGGGQNGCNCIMDDVRVYNRALSATEINQLYKTGATKLGVTPSRANATTTGTTGLGAGLVGHWTFDGKDTTWTSATTGTTRDLSGNGNTGTSTNMNRAIAPTAGKVGQAFNFNGTGSQKVDLNSPTILDDIETQGGGGMTVSVWIKPRSYGEGNEGTIITKGSNPSTSNGSWRLNYSGSGGPLYFHKSFATTILVRESMNGQTKLNKWQHLIVTWDGSASASNVHMYVDGREVRYAPFIDGVGTKVSDTSGSLSVNDGSSREFDGGIDDVRVYNRVLTAIEIQKLYKLGQTRMR